MVENTDTPRNCQTCKDNSTYLYNGACVAGTSCPTNTILIDTNTNDCQDCASPNFFDPVTSSCVSSCPAFLVENTNTPRHCQNCKDNSTYSYNGACVAGTSCPTNTVLIDTNRNGCQDCASPNFFDPVTSSCVSSCPAFLVENTNTPRHCQNCKDSSTYSYNGACVAGTSCPIKTKLANTSRNGCE
ncbi:MAG: hypothetical protein GY861_04100, partial [bacterium]|nr:hypothetical protein [bacterium]